METDGDTPADWPVPRTLPGADYHDAAVFARERQRIFHGTWQCVGRSDDVAEPGAFAVVDVAGESILLVRGDDDRLRAFFNVCRHRGARLCATGGTTRKALTCPYHAWSYGLDGRLIGTPHVGTDERLDRDALGLVAVRLDSWDGFAFVNVAGDAPPLRDHLAAHASDDPFQWARYGVGGLALGAVRTYEVRANWKIIVENYNECLHCPTVHPELVRVVPLYRSGGVVEPAEPDWNGNRLAPGHRSLTPTGQSGLPPLAGLAPGDEDAFYGVTLLPNLIVNYQPDCVSTFLLHPTAPDRTTVICHYLFDAATVAAPGFDPSPVVDFRHALAEQDWAVCERTQLGVTSRAFADGGVLPYNDRFVHAFQERYLGLRDGD